MPRQSFLQELSLSVDPACVVESVESERLVSDLCMLQVAECSITHQQRVEARYSEDPSCTDRSEIRQFGICPGITDCENLIRLFRSNDGLVFIYEITIAVGSQRKMVLIRGASILGRLPADSMVDLAVDVVPADVPAKPGTSLAIPCQLN